jgi:hypothetical protein
MKPWVLVAVALSAVAGILVASSGAEVRHSNSTCRSAIYVGRCYYGRLSGSYTFLENRDYDNVDFHEGKRCPLSTAHWSNKVVVEYFSPAKGPRVAKFSAANPTGSRLDADTSFRAIPNRSVFLTVTYTRETKGYSVEDVGPGADCKGTTYPIDTKCNTTETGFVNAGFDASDGAKRGTAHLSLAGSTDVLVSPPCRFNQSSTAGGSTSAFTYAPTFKKSKFSFTIRGLVRKQPVSLLGVKVGYLTETRNLQWTFCETGKIKPSNCRP